MQSQVLKPQICVLVSPFFFFFGFLGLPLSHVEVPGLGVEWELQLQAYTTGTATPDRSRVCEIQHSCWQYQILNTLSKARIESATSWTLVGFFFFFFFFFCLFAIFLGRSRGTWRFPGKGSNRSCSHRPTPEPQQRGIRAASATYTTAHGNARSLTH